MTFGGAFVGVSTPFDKEELQRNKRHRSTTPKNKKSRSTIEDDKLPTFGDLTASQRDTENGARKDLLFKLGIEQKGAATN